MTNLETKDAEMPSMDDILYHTPKYPRETLAFNPTHEEALGFDSLRVLEEVLFRKFCKPISGELYVREELEKRMRKTGIPLSGCITLVDLWRDEIRSARERNPGLLERRWEEHIRLDRKVEDWDPLKVLGVLPFDEWVVEMFGGDALFRDPLAYGERCAPALTREFVHRLVHGSLLGVKTAAGSG